MAVWRPSTGKGLEGAAGAVKDANRFDFAAYPRPLRSLRLEFLADF
jgi:hypothetical protein